MSKITNKPLRAPAEDDPRRTFEASIAQIQPEGERPSSQRPIFDRKRLFRQGDPEAEKRVLTDAARALARLWKISPALVR